MVVETNEETKEAPIETVEVTNEDMIDFLAMSHGNMMGAVVLIPTSPIGKVTMFEPIHYDSIDEIDTLAVFPWDVSSESGVRSEVPVKDLNSEDGTTVITADLAIR